MTRAAVFGDIHGNLAALEAVLADIHREGVDALLCTGDLVNYGPEPAAVLDRVRLAATACVAGNHDRLLAGWRGQPLADRPGRDMSVETACLRWTAAHLTDEDRGRLAALPERLVRGGGLLLVHGSPASPDEYVYPDAGPARWADLAAAVRAEGCAGLVMGHTHLPMRRSWDGVSFLNPGSVGWPKDGDPRPAWGLLTLPAFTFTIRRVTYDARAAAESIRRVGLPEAVAAAVAAGRPG